MKTIYNNLDVGHLMEEEIVLQNRHQFIYGADNDERISFLQGLEYSYPIVASNYKPMVIYMMDYFLPNISIKEERVSKEKLNFINREYFNLSIVYNILKRISIDDTLNNKYYFGKYSIIASNNFGLNIANNFSDLNELIENAMNKCVEFYKKLESTNNIPVDISSLGVSYIDANEFVDDIKKTLGNKAYFSLIIDNRIDIPELATKTINNFVGSRINNNISIKVVTEIGKWNCMHDLSENTIQINHDFGEIELEENKRVYMKKYNTNRKA